MSIRVVYDTMLFLQAASKPARTPLTLAAVQDGRVQLCISAELLDEVRDVLSRPALVAKFPALTRKAVDAFLLGVAAKAEIYETVPPSFTWLQHPDDDHIFNLAIHVKAEFIVTWETRMLELLTGGSSAGKLLQELSPGLKVITPIQLVEVLR